MGVRFLLEQPQGSMAEEHPRLRLLMRSFIRIYSAAIWHGIYGGASPKRQKLYSNCFQLLMHIKGRAGHVVPGTFQSLRGPDLVTRKRRVDGTMAWTGNEQLKSSQYLGLKTCPDDGQISGVL